MDESSEVSENQTKDESPPQIIEVVEEALPQQQTPMEETQQAPMEETKQTPMEETKQTPMEETQQAPMEETQQPPMEEAKQTPMEETQQPSMEETQQPSMEETKQTPMEETQLTPMEETQQPPMEETKQTPMEETQQPSMEETKQTPMEETEQLPMKETQQTSIKETQQPSMEKAQGDGVGQQGSEKVDEDTTKEKTEMEGGLQEDMGKKGKKKGKGKKAEGGKKKKKEKGKKKKKKGKKLSKKELARLKQQLKEMEHTLKIETRQRRQKEMEQRREQHLKEMKAKEEKLDEEMGVREVHLPQSVEIFKEKDERYFKWESEEKEKNEWETFLRCDPLPLPYNVPGMNSYLYLWRSEQNVFLPLEDKKARVQEVLKLLNLIEDFLDNPVESTERLNSLIVEARDEVRLELQMHLDMSSYVILRQLDQMEGEGNILGEPEVRRYKCKPCPDIFLFLWAAVVPSSTTAFEPAPASAYVCDIPDLGMHVQLPPHAVQPEIPGVPRPELAIRALHLSYDHYSSRSRTNADPEFPEEFTLSIVEVAEREREDRAKKKEAAEAIQKSLEEAMRSTKAKEDAAEEGGTSPSPLEETAPSSIGDSPFTAPLTNRPFKDPRLLDLVDELEEEEIVYLETEDGRRFWEMMHLSERELVELAGEESFLEMVNSIRPTWADHLGDKYDKRMKKYGVIIPPFSIAFGHRLDPETRDVIRTRQLKSGSLLVDILASKERIRQSEVRERREDEEFGKVGEPADELVTKPGEVKFQEADVEYSESSEESLPVFTKLQKIKKSRKLEEDLAGEIEGKKETRTKESVISRGRESVISRGRESVISRGRESVTSKGRESVTLKGRESVTSKGRESVIESESSSPDHSHSISVTGSYSDQSGEMESAAVSEKSSTESNEPKEGEEDSRSEYSSSSEEEQSESTRATDEDWDPSGEFDTSGTDEGLDPESWRKEWSKRKGKGGKGKAKAEAAAEALGKEGGSPKKKSGAKKGKAKGTKKGGRGKKGSPKKKGKKGKKKGKKGKKGKKKSPQSSPLTPITPEDTWLMEEREAVEREKEREKEYGIELRAKMAIVDMEPGELNLRRFAILGGVTHLDLLMHPPQPYQLYDSTMTLTERTLFHVSKTLRELDISDSSLDDDSLLFPLLTSFSGNDSSLQELGLAYLGLNRMPRATLKLVNHSLRYLTLYGNNFHTIYKFSFPLMNQLQELDLRYCDIKTIETSSFKNLPKIETLLLSNNRITNVDGIFIGLNSLQKLDFSHNLGLRSSIKGTNSLEDPRHNIRTLYEGFSDTIFPPSLISLDLSFTEIHNIENFTFKGLSQLQNLSVCYSKLSATDNHSQPFKDLKKLTILDMSGNPWLEMNLSSQIFDGLSSLQELHLDSISNGKNYGYDLKSFSMQSLDSPFQSLPHLRLLSMKQNYIHTLSMFIFSPLVRLETLYLSNNHLISWDSPLFSGNKKLKMLTLHQNQISYISASMLDEITNLSEISLYGNPILCSCEVGKFASLAKSGKIKVDGWQEENSYMCIDKSKKNYAAFDGNWSLECEKEENSGNKVDNAIVNSPISVSSWSTSITYIVIIIATPTIIAVIVVKKKWNYFQWLHQLLKNVDLMGLMKEGKGNSGNAYNYDVFVSYCDHDREWVLNELLPKLEMKNNSVDDAKQPGPAFKVCLHERDFQVGSSILENIMSCMDNSRMILLVVSSTFLQSQWCQFEMHLAQHRLLETRRDDLLLVLLEEIPRSKRPKTLHYLMATKTYIVWNEETNDLFWKRIRRAIKPNPSEKEKSISSFP